MYMILWWQDGDRYLTHVSNSDSSIKLFETIEKADEYANALDKDNKFSRVISAEGVRE